MSDKQQAEARRYYDVLRRIASYQSVEKLKRSSERLYGLPSDEALEMAYDNMQQEARTAIRGKRRPA